MKERELRRFAKQLGVSRVILAHSSDFENPEGEYISQETFDCCASTWRFTKREMDRIEDDVFKRGPVIVLNKRMATARSFTLAHELGHHIVAQAKFPDEEAYADAVAECLTGLRSLRFIMEESRRPFFKFVPVPYHSLPASLRRDLDFR